MLIETSSFRLGIDLIQTLEDSGFTATEIRLNFKGCKKFFEDKKSLSSSVRYSSLAELKVAYNKTYGQIANTGKNPFTVNKGNSFNFDLASAISGNALNPTPTPDIGSDSIPNVFKLGKYAVIRGIKLTSNKLGFPTSYNCINIHKDTFKISRNSAYNRRRVTERRDKAIKSEQTIKNAIATYKRIHDTFFGLYLDNKDTNLEYQDFVADGPKGKHYRLYQLHFPLVKRPITTGLDKNILNPRFLLKK